jgi:putative DNA primase/helicase
MNNTNGTTAPNSQLLTAAAFNEVISTIEKIIAEEIAASSDLGLSINYEKAIFILDGLESYGEHIRKLSPDALINPEMDMGHLARILVFLGCLIWVKHARRGTLDKWESELRSLFPLHKGRTIECDYGRPIYKDEKSTKIGESFWAQWFASEFEDILWEGTEKRFYLYNPGSGLFETFPDEVVKERIAKSMLHAARDWYGEIVERSRDNAKMTAVKETLKGQVYAEDAFKKKANTIHCSNCMLVFDQSSGRFDRREFSPTFRSRNSSPYAFDPVADCPEFKERILGHLDPEYRELLKVYAGQCLIGRNISQTILMLVGHAGASKGAFIKIVEGLIGRKNCRELRPRHVADRFELGMCIGKTLLIGADVDEDFFKSDGAGKIKAMVGGDTLEAEIKGSSTQTTVEGEFNMLISSNALPDINFESKADIGAWMRRLLVIDYTTPFNGQKINNIDEYLLSKEGSGILNWAIQGAEVLLAASGKVEKGEKVQANVEGLLDKSQSVQRFVEQDIVQGGKEGLTFDELFDGYSIFRDEKGYRVMDNTEFNRAVQRAIHDVFQISMSKSLKRRDERGYDRYQNGFRGIIYNNSNG